MNAKSRLLVRMDIQLTQAEAGEAARWLADRYGRPVTMRIESTVRPLPKARGTVPSAKDQIAIEMALRPGGVTRTELEAATGWKNVAPSQNYDIICRRFGYPGWWLDKSTKPGHYRLNPKVN